MPFFEHMLLLHSFLYQCIPYSQQRAHLPSKVKRFRYFQHVSFTQEASFKKFFFSSGSSDSYGISFITDGLFHETRVQPVEWSRTHLRAQNRPFEFDLQTKRDIKTKICSSLKRESERHIAASGR